MQELSKYVSRISDAAPSETNKREWIVTYEGGFCPHGGQPGTELMINKTVPWGSELWHVPAVYSCTEGLVVDFCVEVSPELVKSFIDKWDLLHENENNYTREEREQMRREHPLNIDFQPSIEVNGVTLRRDHGCGNVWIAPSLLTDEFQREEEMVELLDHYGFDKSQCWSIYRSAFSWGTGQMQQLDTLKLHLEREPERIPGIRFISPKVEERVTFVHPVTGIEYTLTVHEYEHKELETKHFPDNNLEYPRHYAAMAYTIVPEISGQSYQIQDCASGDNPRRKVQMDQKGISEGQGCLEATNGFNSKYRLDKPASPHGVMAVSVIGGTHGAKVTFPNGESAALHVVCSSLHFMPVGDVQWRIMFKEKMMEDVNVELLTPFKHD